MRLARFVCTRTERHPRSPALGRIVCAAPTRDEAMARAILSSTESRFDAGSLDAPNVLFDIEIQPCALVHLEPARSCAWLIPLDDSRAWCWRDVSGDRRC